MGLFDGVKEAFSAPARTTIIDAERETPIDRWMGWSVTKDKDADANSIMTPQARTFSFLNFDYCVCGIIELRNQKSDTYSLTFCFKISAR
jgi:hypothetical protein